jgi:hypothetical protein
VETLRFVKIGIIKSGSINELNKLSFDQINLFWEGCKLQSEIRLLLIKTIKKNRAKLKVSIQLFFSKSDRID